jgi:hypothetical protein
LMGDVALQRTSLAAVKQTPAWFVHS